MKYKSFKLSLLFLLIAYFTINAYCYSTDIELVLDKNEYVGLGDRINIEITAPSLNLAKNAAEHLELQVYTSEDFKGFPVYVQETETDSGIFKGQLLFSMHESNPKLRALKVKSGIRIYIMYKDLIEEATWQPDDAEITLDKEVYDGFGILPVVTVSDNDMNLDPLRKEYLYITAYSKSDPTGIKVKLTEKSPDSGVFTGDFRLNQAMSDDSTKKLLIFYDDTITVIYNDAISTSGKPEIRSSSSAWKPCTGTVKLNKSSGIGLYSRLMVTVNDQDLNLRPDYKDIARVRITSKTDPQGFILLANETGVNTAVFSGIFKFSTSNTDSDKNIIKISPTDTITATYIDERNSNNISNTVNTETASFQLSEAKILTSAVNDEGSGNMLDITINEPDANSPDVEDRIIAKVGSGDSMNDMTIYLVETGTNTGNFKCRLYLTGDKSDGRLLQMAGADKINIKYTDNTTPEGNIKDIIKTIKWSYQSTVIKLDRTAYCGYNSSAIITLTNMDLNKDKEKIDFVEVKVDTSSGSVKLKLKETSTDSGKFTGTLYFGRITKRSDGVIKVVKNDTVTISYINKKDKDDKVECSSLWSPQDGTISLDKKKYEEDCAPVKITVKDQDIDQNPHEKDIIKVIARIQGSAKYTSVILTETYNNSGVFTGILYINGGGINRPTITLNPADKLEVVYIDKDTTAGSEKSRTAYAIWGTISKAKLTLDKTAYKGYGTYVTINLDDSEQNLSTTYPDSVNVLLRTNSGKTYMEYTLMETGENTGIFTVQLMFTEETPNFDRICVMAEDEITVSFQEKNVQICAEFRK